MPLGRLIDDGDHFVESFRFRRADGLGRRRRLYSASLTLVVDRLAALAGHERNFANDCSEAACFDCDESGHGW